MISVENSPLRRLEFLFDQGDEILHGLAFVVRDLQAGIGCKLQEQRQQVFRVDVDALEEVGRYGDGVYGQLFDGLALRMLLGPQMNSVSLIRNSWRLSSPEHSPSVPTPMMNASIRHGSRNVCRWTWCWRRCIHPLSPACLYLRMEMSS